jgi:regulator of replication initiation timing
MNEQDATILDLQKTVMTYQTITEELRDENDDLQTENDELYDRIWELESHPHKYHRTALIFALIATLQTINLLIALQ